MESYKVNLDYEAYLFDLNYNGNSQKSIKLIKEFEYVYFLTQNEKSILKNYQNYDADYLSLLSGFGFKIPDFNPDEKQYINWWGQQLNKELEGKLNSKLTSAGIALKNKWGMFDGAIVQSNIEANEWIKSFTHKQWILKNPFGVSGSGHAIYQGQTFVGTYLLEPIHERLFDIGTTFEMINGKLSNMFMVENVNSKNGSFKGGVAAKSVTTFKNYILQKYNFDLTELETITQEIFKIYSELGANANIQIDSFVYRHNDTYKLYPLVEVNYRKTMGLVLNNLAQKINEKLVEWKVTHTDDYEKNSNWIKISPKENRFKSYFRSIS
jgi:hypothetical protein